MADSTPAKKAPAKKAAAKKVPAKKVPAKKAPAKATASASAIAPTVRRVAVIGGNRIPFARSNTVYTDASNQEMLTAALDGLVERYDLAGERVGEFAAGAVLKHSRDFNLARETVLGSKLSPDTPAYDVQQ
ncbi:MAG: acetyl-CoA C-acetyltransferase, partial [Nocardioidaceae bacterium]|nr:acetyl-CoA C-acetyltransferase [Nocardioidaceae bacterium]